ncbi:MAG: thrombospondin type 3 repeat-containing protein, partial [Candidatus Thalassarchaeaceae archaeon]|nr:thrombospondin type 3 repeat-containing protein [Candidatus Thalassarchaeaceae archaeon]
VIENHTTDAFAVSEYHCEIEIFVGLFSNSTDDWGWPFQSFDASFDAPCEDPPEADLTEVWLQQTNWLWCDGIFVDLMSEDGPDSLESDYDCEDYPQYLNDDFSLRIETANLSEDDYYPVVWLLFEVVAQGPDGDETLLEDSVLLKDGQGNVIENHTTDAFAVSEYHCEIEIFVGLYSNWTDDGEWPIESFSRSFDAPCEDPPIPQIVDVELGYFSVDTFSISDGNTTLSESNYWVDVTLSSPDGLDGFGSNQNHTNVVVMIDSSEVYNYTQYYYSPLDGDDYVFYLPGSFYVDFTDCQIQISAFLVDSAGTHWASASFNALGPCDTDTDGDGVGDNSDDFPNDPTETTDSDGDGVGDNSDDFPDDSNESLDSDGDGIGNNADTDDDGDGIDDDEDDTDGDGVVDEDDYFPYDANETTDSDGDGIGDNADEFPYDANETTDTDGDGIGDNDDDDSDGDGLPNDLDDFPLNSQKTSDADKDGVEDEDDAFPDDPNEYIDTDGDGIGNNADADDDGDGTIDIIDDMPLDPTESRDADRDGLGDNADAFPNDPSETTDSDGDGIGDNADAFPNDPSESKDSDGDGTGNNADHFPNDPSESKDTDGDGIGDNADPTPSGQADQPTTGSEEGDGEILPGFSATIVLTSMVGAAILVAGRRRQ